jgi:hypothetical protein
MQTDKADEKLAITGSRRLRSRREPEPGYPVGDPTAGENKLVRPTLPRWQVGSPSFPHRAWNPGIEFWQAQASAWSRQRMTCGCVVLMVR